MNVINIKPDRRCFVDFISQKDLERQLLQAAGKMAEDSLEKVWDNSGDEAYDRL